jgi:integrase
MVAIRDIQLWAGHASIATTEKYMYLRRSAAVRLAL